MVKPNEINQFIENELYYFVRVYTIYFYPDFGISFQFLSEDSLYWNDSDTFKNGMDIVSKLKVA